MEQRYYLLMENLPTGPFSAAEIHAQLESGKVLLQTQVCPVGGSAWLPIMETPGLGPPPLPTESHASPVAPRSLSKPRCRPRDGEKEVKWEDVLTGLVAVGLILWVAWLA